ncbi:spermidine/putrescine-binding periplasmic protein [Spongiibacter sp. IMCC21906]|uniref:ABC transporter substrate-binding protein n=1 Tax=Spongiibacter sp. IMCC21906 TaxID=1620392 RepID=UPI00062DDFB6|nr:extracellular solute-binding protein [Spongiibacter sp. IMCC21906]AKH68639.1 spermidine/putrescine-binding periplasmic protein [Spongiibacter sp. IMCC21906]
MTQAAWTPTRRGFLKASAIAATSLTASVNAPWVHAAKKRPKLRVLGTHVTLQETLRLKAQQDLGIDISFEPGGSSQVLQKASSNPESFDLYEQWSDSINVLWRADAIQSIDIDRLEYWHEINNLTKTGYITPDATIGAGDAPHKLLFVQGNGSLSSTPSKQISFLPYVHNTDSFGYDQRHIPKGSAYGSESWGWLFNEAYRGKVALVNAPTIGIFDAALAARAQGLMEFNDIGNMSRQEIDQLFDILISLKQQGHFCGLWNSVPESIQYFTDEKAIISSMFSPAATALNGQNIPVVYAAPKEGYRAWHGVMCLSSAAKDEAKDAAYKYMNWWLSGWPGAFIARQGYYISNPQRAKTLLSKDEWNYWYAGKKTQQDLLNTNGKIAIKAGSLRRGGSYENRFSNVAVWNTVMDNYEYSLPRWHEFILS